VTFNKATKETKFWFAKFDNLIPQTTGNKFSDLVGTIGEIFFNLNSGGETLENLQIYNLLSSYNQISTMLPAGVILVFCLIFCAFVAVCAVYIQKRLKARKAAQRF